MRSYNPFDDNFKKIIKELINVNNGYHQLKDEINKISKRVSEIENFIRYESYKKALKLINHLADSSEMVNNIQTRLEKLEYKTNILLNEDIEENSIPKITGIHTNIKNIEDFKVLDFGKNEDE